LVFSYFPSRIGNVKREKASLIAIKGLPEANFRLALSQSTQKTLNTKKIPPLQRRFADLKKLPAHCIQSVRASSHLSSCNAIVSISGADPLFFEGFCFVIHIGSSSVLTCKRRKQTCGCVIGVYINARRPDKYAN
jgi:hypothetical protein